ncbi:MAG: hypothetical protein IT233_00225 [Bacteroidia bacterium]|nr:hypothetical protein [Bacteroidia bacterium]
MDRTDLNRVPRRAVLFFCAFLLLLGAARAQDTLPDPGQLLVLSVLQKVETENRIVGDHGPDSLADLPVGIRRQIGNFSYLIAIDSAVFLPEGAYFNAYMALQFPGAGRKICFAARRVMFNPRGVIGGPQARLMLVSDHTIDLFPGLKLRFPADGNNYVDWNCNGYEGVQLKGEFIFSREKLLPDSARTWEKEVKAVFQCYTQDLNDLLAEVSITPFCIRGLKDWSFSVSRAVVDMSSIKNAAGMQFPAGYSCTLPLWTGFYLEELNITLPRAISSSGTRSTVRAVKCLIDEAGFSGQIQVNGVVINGGADMDGWGFSVDALSAKWLCNRLQGGAFNGKIRIPLMDSAAQLNYSASLTYNESLKESDCRFLLSAGNDLSFQAMHSRVDVFPTSFIEVVKHQGKLKPKLVLNGRISFGDPSFRTGKLDVNELTMISEPPYLVRGVFAFTSSGSNTLHHYPLSIHSLSLIVDPQKPSIKADLSLNLSDDPVQPLSASVRVMVQMKHETETVTYPGDHPYSVQKVKWKFDKLRIGGISVNVQTGAFYLQGIAASFENDPEFGTGFRGALKFMVRDVLRDTASASCVFGNSGFRYWYADVHIPVTIPLGVSGFSIRSLSGGLCRNMRPEKTTPEQYIAALGLPPGPVTQRYLPDAQYPFGLKAGCTFHYTPSERAANGDVMLEVNFHSGGGISSVKLKGNVFMLATVAERAGKPATVKGQAQLLFDPVNRIIDAQFSVSIKAGDQVSGQGTAGLHIDPVHWYFMAGRPAAPSQVTLAGWATANTYFMVGNLLDPPLPVPSQVSTLVSNAGIMQQRDLQALGQGQGFVGGIRIGSSLYKETGWDFFTLYGGFQYGCGLDLMLTRLNPNLHCGSIAEPGMNGWMAQGQMYLHLQGVIGIKGHLQPDWCHADWCRGDFDITLLNGSLAMLLSARGPNPGYFHGHVACSYSILGIVNGSCSFDLEAGNNCTFTGP